MSTGRQKVHTAWQQLLCLSALAYAGDDTAPEEAWSQIGFAREWHFSQLGDVIAQFHRAIELDPNFPAPYQGLSQALTYADDIAQSLALARRAVELGPSENR